MIVRIAYDDHRLDVFDTTTFTAATPLGKQNMLTNFEVRFDEIAFGGLWLNAHSYRVEPSFEKDSDTDEAPAARRKKGWAFLLASAEELEHVELVVVDGEAILKRVCGELIDLQSFDEKAYECIGASSKGLHARIFDLYEYLQKFTGEVEPVIPGVPRNVVAAIAAAKAGGEEDEEDDWGDLDEAGW